MLVLPVRNLNEFCSHEIINYVLTRCRFIALIFLAVCGWRVIRLMAVYLSRHAHGLEGA